MTNIPNLLIAMGLFNRLYNITKAEVYSGDDNYYNNYLNETRQQIDTIKGSIVNNQQILNNINAQMISANNKARILREKANDYERKAMLFVRKGHNGELQIDEADKHASEALKLMTNAIAEAEKYEKRAKDLSLKSEQLGTSLNKLKTNLGTSNNAAKTVDARKGINEAIEDNDQRHQVVDSSRTVEMLQRMKNKIVVDEQLAGIYSEDEIEYEVYEEKEIDEDAYNDEVENALKNKEAKSADALQQLKEKMKKINNNGT